MSLVRAPATTPSPYVYANEGHGLEHVDRSRVVNEQPATVQESNELSELWISVQKGLEQESLEDEEEREGEKVAVSLWSSQSMQSKDRLPQGTQVRSLPVSKYTWMS